jgi:hypothetical protein
MVIFKKSTIKGDYVVTWLRRVLLMVGLTGSIFLRVFVAGSSGFTESGITGGWVDFSNCPARTVAPFEFSKCEHAYVSGGAVEIGHSLVPISVPGDTLDLGTEGEEGAVVAGGHGILNGPAQPVPGGLLGAVGNVQITNVSAKLEWAKPVLPNATFGATAACTTDVFITIDICKLI